jgi:hypothetical protein
MARPSRPGLKRFARAALVVGVRVAPLAGVGLVAWMVIGGLPLFTGRSSSARRGDLLPARVGRRRAARACRRPRGPVRRRGLLAQGRPLPPVRRRLAGGEDPGPATVRRLRQTGAAFRPSSRGRASPRADGPFRAGRRGDRADGIAGVGARRSRPGAGEASRLGHPALAAPSQGGLRCRGARQGHCSMARSILFGPPFRVHEIESGIAASEFPASRRRP